jgi:protein O-GlcNAc transferase
MDGCFLCYPLMPNLPPVAPLPALPNGFISFGSFNNLAKISPTTLKLWTDVLNAVPDARVIIKTTRCGDEGTRRRTVERFKALGLPMERVELLGPTRTQAEHLASYAKIDIALDTFPYNGTTTTCEALAMGVPVVSLAGEHHASRVSLSLLTAAGYRQWATNDPAQLVQIARELASDLQTLADMRLRLRDSLRQSTLCDGVSFARKMEKIFRDEWARWCRG